MKQTALAKIKVFASMFIFGTIGIFVRYIPLPSSLIALARGVIGSIFLIGVLLIKRTSFDQSAIKRNLLYLCLSGSALGFNWIMLFESYNYTSVAVSTLCYYMAPIILILISPIVFRERLTVKKSICVILALLGMVFISGIVRGGIPSSNELKGILLGLAAAVLYAFIVLMNKKITGISAYDKTILQLGISAIVLIPYCLLTVDWGSIVLDGIGIWLLLFVGIVHTGFAYYLYFGSMEHISAQSAAMISYVDPCIAVLASVLLLRETMLPVEALGAVLILGAALCSEIDLFRKK